MSLTQSHSILCNASQAAVYAVICESSRWPERFEPCIAVEPVKRNADVEHIRITAHVGGVPMTWESRRYFRRQIFGIDSEVLKPMRLVKRMSTSWRIVTVNVSQCLLVLEHDYDIVDDVSGQVESVTTHEQAKAFIADAIHNNSSTELTNIRDVASRADNSADMLANRTTSHSIVCKASASKVYGVIADVANWPRIFDACVSAAVVRSNGSTTLVRIEAMQSGKLVSWDTSRTYHDNIFRIDFHLPVPMPLMQSMNGQWRVVPIDDKRCVLHVTRNYALLEKVDGIRDDVKTQVEAQALVTRFVEENAEAEMQAIRFFVEHDDATFCAFKAKYMLPYPLEEVYALLADVTCWPDVLPHCEGVNILYDDTENQEFVMQIKTPRGTEYFRSIRNCRRDDFSISYFQPVPPAMLKTHRGSWVVRATPEGSEILSEHAVRVDILRCHELFGEDDLQRNKQRIKELISHNSKATVDACGTWLGQQRRAA